MVDNAGGLYMINNIIENADELKRIRLPVNNVVYEVIRVIDNVPLFLEDHYARMKNSMVLLGIDLDLTHQELKTQIKRLVEETGLVNCNVKTVIFLDDNKQNVLLYISKSYYPSKEQIEAGVGVSIIHIERENPNAKLVNDNYKKIVQDKLEADGTFEVLLVNKDGRITEGSRSNVFFVKGSKIYTAPGEYVLKGITRDYIIDACERLGYEVIKTLIGVDSLNEMDGLFLSGTSIKVLPVSKVGDLHFNSGSNPVVVTIRDVYNGVINEYLKVN